MNNYIMATFQERINSFRSGLDAQQNHFNEAMGNAADYGRQVLQDKLGQHYENIEKTGGAIMTTGLAVGQARGAYKRISSAYRQQKSGKPSGRGNMTEPKAPKTQEFENPAFDPRAADDDKPQKQGDVAQPPARDEDEATEELTKAPQDKAIAEGQEAPKGKGRAKTPPPEEATEEAPPPQPTREERLAQLKPSDDDIAEARAAGKTSLQIKGVGGGTYRYDTQKQTIVDEDAPGEAVSFDKPSAGVGSATTNKEILRISDEADMRNMSAPGAGDNIAKIFQQDAQITATGRAVGQEPPVRPTQVSDTLPSVSELRERGGTGIGIVGDTDTGQRLGNLISSGGSGGLAKAPKTISGTPEQISAQTSQRTTQAASQIEQQASKGAATSTAIAEEGAEGALTALSTQAGAASKGLATAGKVAGGIVGARQLQGAATKIAQKASGATSEATSGISGDLTDSATSYATQALNRVGSGADAVLSGAKSAVQQGIRGGAKMMGMGDGAIDAMMSVGEVAADAVPVIGDLVGAGMLIYGLVKDFKHQKSTTPQLTAPQLETTQQAGGLDTKALGGSQNTGGGIV